MSGALPTRTQAWRSVTLLCFIYAWSFVDRQILSLLVAPIRQDLGISDVEISLLHGFAFALLYAVCGLPIGAWVDRYDRRRVLMVGAALWSVFTVLCATARSFPEMFLYRVGVGIGEATVVPVTYSLIADYFAPHKRGVAMGGFGVGVYAGLGIALIVGGAVAGTLASWQLVFVLVGLPGLVCAPLALLVFEPRRNSASVLQTTPRAAPLAGLRHVRATLRPLLCHHGATACLAMALYGLVAWAPEFLRRTYDVPASTSGIRVGAVVGIAGVLGVISGGLISDWLIARGNRAARMVTLLGAALLAMPFAAALAHAQSAEQALVLMAGATFFFAMLTVVGPTGIQELYPPHLRGFGAALFQLVVTLVGLGAGPTIVALVSEHVLQSESRLGESLAYALPIMSLAAAGFAALGMRSYARVTAQPAPA